MAMRSIGSLTISFGLVAIPVKLYTATQTANSISFNLLHKGCGSRLKQQYVCLKDGQTVERDDMVKGYEFSKDQYVQFSNEEIKAMEEIGTHSIDIAEFVPIESIDPVYFDKTYYLAPDKGGSKPYGLLNEALKDTKRCAIGRWAARGKSYLVALRPVGDVLTMQQLHFANEVRAATEVDVVKPDVKAPELKLAKQLIEQQTTEKFDPTAYVDDVRARRRGGDSEEGRRPGDLHRRRPGRDRRQGHRSHGGPARQSHQDRNRQGERRQARPTEGPEASRTGGEACA